MAKPVTRFAEPSPNEPRDHEDFERFIRELDAGRMPPCRPKERRTTNAD